MHDQESLLSKPRWVPQLQVIIKININADLGYNGLVLVGILGFSALYAKRLKRQVFNTKLRNAVLRYTYQVCPTSLSSSINLLSHSSIILSRNSSEQSLRRNGSTFLPASRSQNRTSNTRANDASLFKEFALFKKLGEVLKSL